MSTGTTKRKRSSLALPPGQLARLWVYLRRREVLVRLGCCALAAILMWIVTGGWSPPFPYRTGYIPPRDIVARTEFSVKDEGKTEEREQQLRAEMLVVYANDPQKLKELRRALKDRAIQVAHAESYDALDKRVWGEFLSQQDNGDEKTSQQQFTEFRKALADDPDLTRFEQAVQRAFEELERDGLLENLHPLGTGSQTAILVHSGQQGQRYERVEVKGVRIAEVSAGLEARLQTEFATAGMPAADAATVSQRVATWLKTKKLPPTLVFDDKATKQAYDLARAQLEPVMRTFKPDVPLSGGTGYVLADGGEPLSEVDIKLLKDEHRAFVAKMGFMQVVAHSLADFGMFTAMFVLCGVYIFYHHRRMLTNFRRFVTLLGLFVVTVTLCKLMSASAWQAELIPIMLFGMTVAIAYERELALLLTAVVALIVALSFGQSLPEFVIMVAAVVAAVLLLGRIRSRTKLIYVGMGAAVVTSLTAIGVGTLVGQPFGASKLTFLVPFSDTETLTQATFALRLIAGSVWFGFCAVLAGLVMTGLLPFIEKLFDVQTDMSLLELGDARHPLLQQLVQRAPGTYNHSINVASLSEAAADAIGANGLLARVGAYFHDIGKMLKPQYFVENQAQDVNKHESLLPAMSTLVIIAHVKDGADLARQHGLPQSIIDFIEQHHGTTLVEYFFDRATKQSESDPDLGEVNEENFRYPGPKPQTKEAGAMMLADAVESASRALVDPAPSRIENLVEEIGMKRLLDGQFDECGLTLKELHIVQESLIKSLCAMYHGRVKYPEKQHTA